MNDPIGRTGQSPVRQNMVRFLDRSIQSGLLLALVVLPLGFQRFLILFPLDVFPFSAITPAPLLTRHTPLNFKEALAAFVAIYVLALWLARTLLAGRLRLVWTPLHPPFLVLVALSALSLFAPQARLLRLRDFGLVICYVGFVHLFLLYGWQRPFRRRCLNLFLIVSAVFTAIVFAMDRQWYFGPFAMVVSDHNRQSLYATIGHNIAVASYLMIIAVYVAGRLIEARSVWKRLLYGAWVVLVVDLIIAAQTVGVWLALVLLVPLIVWQILLIARSRGQRIWRHRGVRWTLGTAIIIALLFLGLFALNERMRQERPGSTPLERLRMRADPRILSRGTRARLWTIALHLVRERFPLGVGFSGFKYIYAEEQAKYFREHPDSILVPTDRHTDRVHNEYLQVWVELGAVGLIVLLWGLMVFVRLQVRMLRAGRLRAREQLRATTAFVALAATLFHLLTSFEFHVPTTTLFFVLGLSWWVGEGRLGRLKTYSMPNLASSAVWAPALTALVVLAAAGFAVLVARHVIADSYFCMGEYVRKEEENLPWAAECFDRARRLAPYRGQVAYHEGFCVFRIGEQYARQRQPEKALRYLQHAIQLLTETLETYQFKDVYYYRAKAQGIIGVLTGQQDILNRAVQDYRKTIEIYPQELAAYYELGKLYYNTQRRNLAFDTWKQAQKYDFEFMRDYHIIDAEYMVSEGAKELAMDYYRMAIILSPKNGEYYGPLLKLFEEAGRYEEAVRLLKAFVSLHPEVYEPMAHLARLELLAGNQGGAEKQLKQILEADPATYQSVLAAEFCYHLLGQDEEGTALLEGWLKGRWDRRFTLEEFAVMKRLDEAYGRRGETAKQETLWTKLIALPQEQLLVVLRSRALVELARVRLQQGQVLKAMQLHRQRMQLPHLGEEHGLQACADFLAVLELPFVF